MQFLLVLFGEEGEHAPFLADLPPFRQVTTGRHCDRKLKRELRLSGATGSHHQADFAERQAVDQEPFSWRWIVVQEAIDSRFLEIEQR